MKTTDFHDVCVVGTGPAGMAAALALASLGLRVAAVGMAPRKGDTRTAALFAGSITLLENLGAGEVCRQAGEPIHGVRIIDDMGALLRAPEVIFTPAETGLERFGYNVPNSVLVEALRRRAAELPGLTLIEAGVEQVAVAPDEVELHLGEGRTIASKLVVGADGRQSLCRKAADIPVRTWIYEQSALTCTFMHQRMHGGISTEFHRPAGPFTVVPSPGRASSLVWVERPPVAQQLAGLDDATFRAVLEERLQGLLGQVDAIGPRGVFPLSGLAAEAAGRNRIALVGEAVHVIPPIGAQGLNLGLRDAACLADCVADAQATGSDIGAPSVLEAYGRMRSTDVASRIWTIDLLNRSLLSRVPPVQALRGLGLHILKNVGPIRRFAIREGLSPSFITPRLMQPAEPAPVAGP
ncbi:MAG TPA: UbiH/UbiF family hydroxylase [Hyphomicrobium sp.]|jgi:2-octaprenyl-6-methoxyphenol hydroxylase